MIESNRAGAGEPPAREPYPARAPGPPETGRRSARTAAGTRCEPRVELRALTGAELLVQALLDEGVDLVFGYPGGAIMPIYDALYGTRERLRHVLVRHEQGAGHCAQGYARASGRTGVCMGTSGPGATNLLTALADALMDSTPLVAITGQVAGPKLGTDAFQEADAVGMSLPATRWAWQVTNAAEVPWAVRMAFAVARGAIAGPGPERLGRKPGPVLLDITRDAQTGTARAPCLAPAPAPANRPPPAATRAARVAAPYPAPVRPVTRASGSPVDPGEAPPPEGHGRSLRRADPHGPDRRNLIAKCDAAARLLNRAERPYLLAGQGVTLAGAEAELREVAERGRFPVGLTLLGLSALPSDHPLNVGLLGMHGKYGANVLTNEADVILAVGMRFDDRVTGNLETYAREARIIHIDIDPSEINKAVPAEVAIEADARAALATLAARIRGPAPEDRTRTDWLARFREHDAIEREAVIDAELGGAGPEIRMGEAVHALGRASGGEAVIVSDVGQHQMHAARYYPFTRPRSHITSGGLGTMGFALPAAIGAKLGAPEREVVAIIGDGGFQMTLQELGTVMQERLAVKLLILDNAFLGMVRQWQSLFFGGRYSEVGLANPDFVRLAEAYGIAGERVSARDDLAGALERLLAADGPRLLTVAVAREDDVFPMIPAGAGIADMRLA
ncbi:MAG: thiamine pyrophosphate-dependent enzyme [Immundisolibacterales bacterium]|nr:thiamine pyrophosphate-dependent enzyme [Immundisolibacterales bacterium]